MNLWFQNSEVRDLVATLVRLWILYQAKSLAPTIEDLIGIFMRSYCKSTTIIKRVAMKLVMYWDLCKVVSHRLEICVLKKSSTKSSPIGDWSKYLTIGWYFGIDLVVIRFLILVITWFLNNGFLGMVTWKSLCGVFTLMVFPISQQITVSNLFSIALQIIWWFVCTSTLFACNLTKLINLSNWIN